MTFLTLLTAAVVIFLRFSFEGIVQTIYGFDRKPLECNAEWAQMCVFRNPKTMLNELDVNDAKIYVDFIVLCVFFVVLRIIGCLILRYRIKAK